MYIAKGILVLSAFHFFNTVNQILHHDAICPVRGIAKHLIWQARKLFGLYPMTLKISNSYMHVVNKSGVASLVNCMNMYDYNNMNLVREFLSLSGGIFFDIGANIGSYTLIASEIDHAIIVSFEPNNQVFQQLVNNIRINNRNNVRAVNCALSDHDGSVFLISTDQTETTSVTLEKLPGSVLSKACKLDSFCMEHSLSPHIIKIDVEGHEKEILTGFKYKNIDTKLIIIEHGNNTEVRELLSRMGFSGPWYFYYKHRRFLSKPQNRAEDPVYVRQSFVDNSSQYGFSFPVGVGCENIANT